MCEPLGDGLCYKQGMNTISPKPSGEILAPAGDQACLEAALAAGADAVYFGLDEGFNARARASNFRMERLPEVVSMVHRAGARAYLALNTLVFEAELPKLEEILRGVARAGVDALIVQDPGLALLAKAICPDLELHASTQMTISSPEGATFAKGLGITRVVVPRELSVKEIRTFREGTDLELEAFIMGALCVSWSGQCLSSEAWGGRSANRGRCAQACRLPYELVVDGAVQPLGEVSYLLSPQDLAGFRAVEELLEIGVHTLKIEGRQKGSDYVHHAVGSMRRWVDSVRTGNQNPERLAEDLRDLTIVYSRGFGDGFLAGSDHQTLVDGRTPRHRGLFLGTVVDVLRHKVIVDCTPLQTAAAEGEVSSPLPALGGATSAASGAAIAPVIPEAGMGVVFSQGDEQDQEQGGPIFRVDNSLGDWALSFGTPGPDLRKVRKGARVYVTSDPKLVVKRFDTPHCRLPMRLRVSGAEGQVLHVHASVNGFEAESESAVALQPSQKRELDRAVLEENLGALGGTPFHLEQLELELPGGLFLPLANLREIRRDLVEQLEPWILEGPGRRVRSTSQLDSLRAPTEPRAVAAKPTIVALCRNDEQLQAAIDSGIEEVELDWMELVALNSAVQKARTAGMTVGLATVRVQKPGEEVYDRRLERLAPDSVLVRHWGALTHFRDLAERPILHGDFSLNVTNSLTANHLLQLGLETITASHDLDKDQLMELLKAVDPARVAVTVHHHIPTFHTEHCVYSHLLSQGRDFRSCGRPCENHQVSLKDRVGLEHPVIVDVGCRNTVFNALAQSGAFLMNDLARAGVRRFRVEFVRESKEEAHRVLQGYGELLAGQISIAELISRIQVIEQFGVTRGTMQLLG
jgi:putative protease